MAFKMKYNIETKYLPIESLRRSGEKNLGIRFLTAHDTGNDGSTAYGNVGYYINSANEMEASAHTFIDDLHIVECIPLDEKAWHVVYSVTTDNNMFGDDANDVSIGIELCYSWQKGSIDNAEAYKRYIWYHAYLCNKFGIDPKRGITGHYILDPARKLDPGKNAFVHMGITWEQFLEDVAAELADCLATEPLYAVYQGQAHLGDFYDYISAAAEAEKWAGSYVTKIADGSWVWTNIKPDVKEVPKLDATTIEEAKQAIDKLAAAGLITSPDYWKQHVEEGLPVWAYMLVEARKLNKE